MMPAVENAEVVRLILQFLQEYGLQKSVQASRSGLQSQHSHANSVQIRRRSGRSDTAAG